jgi:hypothetical protein
MITPRREPGSRTIALNGTRVPVKPMKVDPYDAGGDSD